MINKAQLDQQLNFMNKKMQLIPIGGLGEVGKNCTVIEYRDEILIIDFGIRFGNDLTPGVDFFINDMSYLVANKEKIKGIVLTHGHLDHIGGLPYLFDSLGVIPIFATRFTAGMIRNVFSYKSKLDPDFPIEIIKRDKKFSIGSFTIDPIISIHSIVDNIALAITTEVGTILHSGDYKTDKEPYKEEQTNFEKFNQYKNCLLLLSDSTNSGNLKDTVSESEIFKNLTELINKAKSRVIVSTFSTQITRIRQILDIAKQHKKKVFFSGFSMQRNLELAIDLNFFENFNDIIVDKKSFSKIDEKDLIIICTGSQAEENSSLMKIVNDEHPIIKFNEEDTVLFCSSVIPGNEYKIGRLINKIVKKKVKVIDNKKVNIHSSGHGGRGQMKDLLERISPRYFMPVHGEDIHLDNHKEIAIETKLKKQNVIIAENGQKIELTNDKFRFLEKLKLNHHYIENNKQSNVNEEVLRERLSLGKNGVLVVFVFQEKGELKDVKLKTKGFVNINKDGEVLEELKQYLFQLIEKNPSFDSGLEKIIRKNIKSFFNQKRMKSPNLIVVT